MVAEETQLPRREEPDKVHTARARCGAFPSAAVHSSLPGLIQLPPPLGRLPGLLPALLCLQGSEVLSGHLSGHLTQGTATRECHLQSPSVESRGLGL